MARKTYWVTPDHDVNGNFPRSLAIHFTKDISEKHLTTGHQKTTDLRANQNNLFLKIFHFKKLQFSRFS